MSDTLLTFIHISDTHINPDESYIKPYATYTPVIGTRALVESIRNLPFKADFILHTGDVIYDPHESAYATVKELFCPIDIPIHYLAGNHDHNDGLQRHLMGRSDDDIVPNLHYEIEVSGVQIVFVDSNGPATPPAGFVTQKQLDWLDSICSVQDDRPLIVAVHHNPVDVDIPWLDNAMRITNGLDVHNVIKKARSRLVGVFHGHIHESTTVYRDGIMYSAAASPWAHFITYPGVTETIQDVGARPGYSVVMVKPNQSFTRRYWFEVPQS